MIWMFSAWFLNQPLLQIFHLAFHICLRLVFPLYFGWGIFVVVGDLYIVTKEKKKEKIVIGKHSFMYTKHTPITQTLLEILTGRRRVLGYTPTTFPN